MVLPRWLAQFNKRSTNRVLGAIPRQWSPFVELHHVGRRSGRAYVALIAAFRADGGYILTPTYGPGADWVRNAIAMGTCSMDRRGESVVLDNVRLIGRGEAWPHLPMLVRGAMRVLGVEVFVRADARATAAGETNA